MNVQTSFLLRQIIPIKRITISSFDEVYVTLIPKSGKTVWENQTCPFNLWTYLKTSAIG